MAGGTNLIFISYARKDAADLADKLREDLQKSGYQTWHDTSTIPGGADWAQAIESGIEGCQFFLALLSEASYTSETCRAEQGLALDKGKRVIPILVYATARRPLRLNHLNYRDFSDLRVYRKSFQLLIADLCSGAAAAPLARHRTLVTAPPVSEKFVDRPEEFEELRRAVLADEAKPHVALIALRGMGGIGKTSLAKALCHDQIIQAAFPDGVFWVDIGQEPDLVDKMKVLADAFKDDLSHYFSENAGRNRLREILHDKAALLVLDDVWDHRHIEPFWVEAPRCRTLFTTRDANISLFFGAEQVQLDAFRPEQSNELLRKWAGRDDPDFPEIAMRLGHLAQALKIAGAWLRGGMSGTEWLSQFQHVSQIRLGRYTKTREENLEVCFDVSVERIPEADRFLYYSLGILPKDVPVPREVIGRLWRQLYPAFTEFDCQELLSELSSLALLEIGGGTVSLHALLQDYTREKIMNRVAVHEQLLSVYDPGQKSWSTVCHDDYFFRHARHHFMGAQRQEDLRHLLLNFDWLNAKLDATDPSSVIGDYEVFKSDRALHLVQASMRLAAHIIARDKNQMAAQLVGRLLSAESLRIQSMLDQAKGWGGVTWLRPLISSLTPPGPLVRTFEDHTESVWGVAVTPDGERALSCADDAALKLWDLERGIAIRTFQGLTDLFRLFSLTPDGGRALSVSQDNTLRLWNLDTGQPSHVLEGHRGRIRALAVTPEGRRAITASSDCTLKLWDLETGIEVRTFSGHINSVTAVAVSPDARHAVSASDDGTLKLWDLDADSWVRSFEGHAESVRAVAMAPDGRQILSASEGGTLKLWDLESGSHLRTFERHADSVLTVAVISHGREALSVRDDTLEIWGLEDGAVVRKLQGHTDLVGALAVTPDGKRALSASNDRTLKLWDLESGVALPQTPRHVNGVNVVTVMQHRHYALSASNDRTLRLWDLERGAALSILEGHTESVRTAVLISDSRALSASDDHTLKLWNLEDGTALQTFEGHTDSIRALVVTADGLHALSASRDRTLKLWDLGRGREEEGATLVGHTDSVTAVAVTSDGRRALSASEDNTLKLWDLEHVSPRMAALRTLRGHTGAVNVVVLPDAQRVLSASDDCTLKLWDVESGAVLRTFEGHTNLIRAMALLPDAQRVLSASDDCTLKLWDVESGAVLRTFEGHTNLIRAIAVTQDGRYAVSGSDDRTLRLWDLASGVVLAIFSADAELDSCVVAHSEWLGRAWWTVIVGDRSGCVHFLRLGPDEELKDLSSSDFKDLLSKNLLSIDCDWT